MTPKLWNDRDFDECAFPVGGAGYTTLVCAEPCRGTYCPTHLKVMATPDPYHHMAAPKPLRLVRPPRPPREPKPEKPAKPTPEEIETTLRGVAWWHGLPVRVIRGGGVIKAYVAARHEACWQLHELGLTFTEIAKAVGLKDHTSAANGVRRHAAVVAVQPVEQAA